MSLGADLVQPLEQEGVSSPALAPDPASPDAPDAPAAARPRLARTVTLGETVASEPAPAPAAPGPAGAPVQVVINNYVTVPSYDAVPVYAPLYPALRPAHHGGGREGGARVEAGRGTRSQSQPGRANVTPGQDFPAPRSYGPSFPFKTAPASPWQ
jgi:hypothetical protein